MNIKELQEWVEEDWDKNSIDKPSLALQLLFLAEEIGELSEAIRKVSLSKKPRTTNIPDIGSEFADVIISLVTLANTYKIDLATEILEFQKRLSERHKNNY